MTHLGTILGEAAHKAVPQTTVGAPTAHLRLLALKRLRRLLRDLPPKHHAPWPQSLAKTRPPSSLPPSACLTGCAVCTDLPEASVWCSRLARLTGVVGAGLLSASLKGKRQPHRRVTTTHMLACLPACLLTHSPPASSSSLPNSCSLSALRRVDGPGGIFTKMHGARQ